MADTFESWRAGLESPAEDAFEITPDDDTDLDYVTRGIYVGGSGDLEVITKDGTTIVFTDIAAGIIHPLRVSRVKASNTSATGIIGLL